MYQLLICLLLESYNASIAGSYTPLKIPFERKEKKKEEKEGKW